MGLAGRRPAVLTACPPCTGFSRTIADQPSARRPPQQPGPAGSAITPRCCEPDIVLIENARELVTGRFRGHLREPADQLAGLGYQGRAGTHLLTEFGLPQRRERAIVVAVRQPLRRARPDRPVARLAGRGQGNPCPARHLGPAAGAGGPATRQPTRCTCRRPSGRPANLRPARRRAPRRWQLGRPARPPERARPAHSGHGEASRAAATLAATRMSTAGCGGTSPRSPSSGSADTSATAATPIRSRTGCARSGRCRSCRASRGTTSSPARWQNMYRHIGDAVPPLISYQLAALCQWILTGRPAGARGTDPARLSPGAWRSGPRLIAGHAA